MALFNLWNVLLVMWNAFDLGSNEYGYISIPSYQMYGIFSVLITCWNRIYKVQSKVDKTILRLITRKLFCIIVALQVLCIISPMQMNIPLRVC